eukprot:CAMPEP_0183297974 /NCGR_PEP_ID=MMETSP0160_2-20130417/5117_1 /TAXON_ID=2839 ORGANISM="Odontella Sinensis, Strain Grunow 1884" /NCGR_SAMPLE_ID=MMETSP0160_2 /ASSEMBLY_ACC=CAM_ASM_000250 /LENGTH=57 /DNA_ID=CAMNT_0025459889 /DNA_START=163 /DNA_END=333 /DNA_ORIENTATION=+
MTAQKKNNDGRCDGDSAVSEKRQTTGKGETGKTSHTGEEAAEGNCLSGAEEQTSGSG